LKTLALTLGGVASHNKACTISVIRNGRLVRVKLNSGAGRRLCLMPGGMPLVMRMRAGK